MIMTASHVTLLLLLLAVLACLLAGFARRRLTAPLACLAEVTTNLPAKFLRHQASAWPYSLVIVRDHRVEFVGLQCERGNDHP
jgi:hypothetical protein